MQEQANEKTVGLVCRSARMTATAFTRVCERYLQHRRMIVHEKKMAKRYDPGRLKVNKPQKIKVKELVKEGSGVSSVEIKDEKIRQFEKLARRNGVRYAIKKDKSTVPPTYIVFFKAKDGEVLDRTMKEFLKKSLNKDGKAKDTKAKDGMNKDAKAVTERETIRDKLKKYKAVAAEAAKESKIRNKIKKR